MNTIGIMNLHLKTTLPCLILFLLLIGSWHPFQAQLPDQDFEVLPAVSPDEIIQEGIRMIQNQQKPTLNSSMRLDELVTWYKKHPFIDYATCTQTSITVKFIDGSCTVLLDPLVKKQGFNQDIHHPYLFKSYTGESNKTAVILNPAESMYGHHQCQRIITILLNHDYSIEYLANQAVDVSYIKNNLSVSIIYMNTHAGYFDVDGDSQADAVVIATGELWTNETETKYASEIENHLIVKGLVGDTSFVAFTPALIEQYYMEKPFPNSLVFMATCYALYDDSMAEKFLDAGASVYMGWSQNTVFWTNSQTSIRAFRLLSYGLTVQQVCRFIRSGGFYNWLFHSKLIYQGDGTYRIL